MSSRYFYPSTGAAAVSPVYSALWDQTTGADRLACVLAKITSAMTNKTSSESIVTNGWKFLSRQYVSAPIGAGEISGTVKGQIRCAEDSIAGFCRSIIIKVVSNDGSTLRGTLLSHFPGALTSEYVRSATLANRYFPPAGTALTPVTAINGDRLVFEVGTKAFNVSTTLYTASHSFGDNSASDLPEDETTTTADNPFIEFSMTIPDPLITATLAETLTLSDAFQMLMAISKSETMTFSDQITALKLMMQELPAEAVSILDTASLMVMKVLSGESISVADEITAYAFRKNNPLAQYDTRLLVDMFLDSGTRKFSSEDLYIQE